MYQTVLVAVDFTPGSDQVCAKAQALCRATAARLLFVHVIEPVVIDPAYDIAPIYPVGFEQEMERVAGEKLRSLGDAFGVAEADRCVVTGSTKGEILRVAQSQGANLIVVGSHGRHGLALLLGSTANAVLHGAPCDVLAVRV
jgi:universal stress protein A